MPVFYSYSNMVKVKDNKIAVQGDNIEKEIRATRNLIGNGFMLCFQPFRMPKGMKSCGKIAKPHDIQSPFEKLDTTVT